MSMSPRLKRMFDEWGLLDARINRGARGKLKTTLVKRKARVGGIIARIQARDDKKAGRS